MERTSGRADKTRVPGAGRMCMPEAGGKGPGRTGGAGGGAREFGSPGDVALAPVALHVTLPVVVLHALGGRGWGAAEVAGQGGREGLSPRAAGRGADVWRRAAARASAVALWAGSGHGAGGGGGP
jgi:hypothetical protein